MARELLGKLSNHFDETIRGRPDQWTEEKWRAVYSFQPGGLAVFSRKDEFCHGRFKGPMHSKDGYAVEDCIDERHRHLLEFLIPILHPEKPKRLTITLGNQVFSTIIGNRKLDWSRIMFDLVSGLITRSNKSRATPLSPYLFHLYHENRLLSGTEEKSWKAQEVLLRYRESETDDENETPSGSKPESDEEEGKLKLSSKRLKTTPPNTRGTPPPTVEKTTKEPEGKLEGKPEGAPARATTSEESDPLDPFEPLIDILCNI